MRILGIMLPEVWAQLCLVGYKCNNLQYCWPRSLFTYTQYTLRHTLHNILHLNQQKGTLTGCSLRWCKLEKKLFNVTRCSVAGSDVSVARAGNLHQATHVFSSQSCNLYCYTTLRCEKITRPALHGRRLLAHTHIKCTSYSWRQFFILIPHYAPSMLSYVCAIILKHGRYTSV